VPLWISERSRDGGVDEVPLPDVPGRLWLCGKHAIGPDVAALLARTGADTVVCLNEAHELADRYPGYVEWLGSSPQARWVPVPDLHAPPVPVAGALVDEVVDRLAGGAGVVVHCGAGMGRAGTLAAAVLLALGLDLDGALRTVATARPGAGPERGVQQELLEALVRRSAGSGRPPRTAPG